jgi:hypothetical protein
VVLRRWPVLGMVGRLRRIRVGLRLRSATAVHLILWTLCRTLRHRGCVYRERRRVLLPWHSQQFGEGDERQSTRAFAEKVESMIVDSQDGANRIQDRHWYKGGQ